MTTFWCPSRLTRLIRAAAALVIAALLMVALAAPAQAMLKPKDDEPAAESDDEEMPAETKPGKSKSSSDRAKSKSAKTKTTKVAPKTKEITKARGKTLKYAFEQGRKYVYDVKVEVDLGDSTDTIVGQTTYNVKSVGDDEIVLEYHANLVKHAQQKAGTMRFRDPRHRGAFAGFPGFFGGAGELTIDRFGTVKKDTGDCPLPFLLGDASTLVLDRLSSEGNAKWEIVNDLSVVTRPQAGGPPGFGRSRAISRAIRGEPQPRQYTSTATEKTEYQRGSGSWQT